MRFVFVEFLLMYVYADGDFSDEKSENSHRSESDRLCSRSWLRAHLSTRQQGCKKRIYKIRESRFETFYLRVSAEIKYSQPETTIAS